jgi:hypothetical protein
MNGGAPDADNVTNGTTQTFRVTAAPGTIIKLYEGATQIGQGTADAGGIANIGTTLGEGPHTVQARTVDGVGNASAPSAGVQVSVDTTPPTVSITTEQATLKAGETVRITFTFSDDPGPGWGAGAGDVTVTGGTLSGFDGTGPVRTATFTPAADVDAGTASISVQAGHYTDPAGNNGLASNTLTLTYDTKAPDKPGIPEIAAGQDTGTSDDDGITNQNPLTLTGTAQDGVTVKLYDGASVIASTTASGGKYSFTLTGLAEGNHAFAAVAVDAAGNTSAISAGQLVVIDRTPPATTVDSVKLSDDTGTSVTDMITSKEEQTVSGTLNANLASGERVMVSIDNGASWTAATASEGGKTWELAGVTLHANDTLQVRVVDLAGNAGTAATHAYTVDKVGPAAPSAPDLDTGSDSGSSHTDNITSVTTPAFSGTAEAGATVRLFDGGIEIGSDVAEDGTWHIATSSATPLEEGLHSITAIATDLAGNSSINSAALEVEVRLLGPSTKVETMTLSADTGVDGDFVTKEKTQTLSGLLSKALAAGERVQVSLDGGHAWIDAAGAAGSKAWSLPVTLTAGTNDIQVQVIDALDNVGPVRIQAYTLDSVKPVVAIASSTGALRAGETATISFTFSENPGASFDGTDLVVSGGTLSAIEGSGTVRTAVFTPDADVNAGTASIVVKADSYEDLAGNLGTAGVTPTLTFDTLAPNAPLALVLDKGSDSGASDSDKLTHERELVFTGTAEAGATVRLYDGGTEIGHGTADGGTFTITSSALLDGSHTIVARAFDAAGNASSASGTVTVVVDTAAPAAVNAPLLSAASDSGAAGDGITRVKSPTLAGTAEAGATLTLYDGATVLGTATANNQGAWEFTVKSELADGVHTISALQQDGAGNQSAPGKVFELTVDTLAPAAPAAPLLKASSDTETVGDGITANNMPVIEGTALANTLVTLYDSVDKIKVKIGSAMSDGAGKWSIQAPRLDYGAHSLSATQSDAAGNESAASPSFALRIDAPPVPLNLIDGVAVDIQPVSFPGGINGSAVAIPIVGLDRVESVGSAGVADIPLATGTAGNLLLAQVAPGYGLSASGANAPVASAGELLIAAIKAATPSHAAGDQGHLTGNGQSFLAGLASSGSLLVETVKPVSAGAPAGSLTLSGPAPGGGQSTALVIDASGLATGSTIALQQLNFAAVIGSANVVTNSSMVLSGDAAGQHFTVAAGGSGAVFAGGGSDTLGFGAAAVQAPAPAAGTTLLHGGSASDVASFSGARAEYSLDVHNGYVIVSSKSNPAVKAMVVNVEQLQFSDASVAVQNNADMGTLAGIYQTVLGRQADVMGIEYWANVHQAGASWGAIVLDMIGSSEQVSTRGGFNGVAAHDVGLLYTAIFNRDADAGGLAYWTGLMSHGTSLEQVATSFVHSVEMVGHQRAATDWDFFVG